jgi:hypothetical protein
VDAARSAYWSLLDRDRREVASWRLAAELSRLLPVTGVLELHEGGGQYDTLHLALTATGTTERAVKINRATEGRVYLVGAPKNAPPEPSDRLARITAGPQLGPSALSHEASEVAAAFGVVASSSPGWTPLTFMADLLERAMRRSSREPWAWMSGIEDSSMTGARWRDELFQAVPAASGVRRGALDPCEQHIWFLTRAGEPVLAVDVRDETLFVEHDSLARLSGPAITRAMTAVRRVAPKGGASLPTSIGGQEYATLPQARRAYQPVAQQIAEEMTDQPVSPFNPGSRITTYAHWFSAGTERLVLVMGPHENPASAVTLLAYGLAWQSRRRLDLVLPAGFADAVMRVLPWIRSDVHVHLASGAILEALLPPTSYEVLKVTAALPARATTPHDLGALRSFLDPLLEAIDAHELAEQPRPSYCAWKFRGRQVLKAARAKGNTIRIVAGTDYSTPTDTRPAAYKIEALSAPMNSQQVEQAREAIDRSIADRLSGADAGDREHQLQADLDVHQLPGLGVTHHHREYPAWRSEGSDGFIDFLASTTDGALDVIETKVGADAAVALQALEYFIWATANADAVRNRMGWPQSAGARHQLTLVLAADEHGRCYDRYLYGVLEAFSLDVLWRVFTTNVTDTTANASQAPTLTPLNVDQMLSGDRGQVPCAQPRWPDDTIESDNDLFALLGVDSESSAADALFAELDGALQLGGGEGVTLLMGSEFETFRYPFSLRDLRGTARDMESAEDRRQASEQ